jgi:hypothetical protein
MKTAARIFAILFSIDIVTTATLAAAAPIPFNGYDVNVGIKEGSTSSTRHIQLYSGSATSISTHVGSGDRFVDVQVSEANPVDDSILLKISVGTQDPLGRRVIMGQQDVLAKNNESKQVVINPVGPDGKPISGVQPITVTLQPSRLR